MALFGRKKTAAANGDSSKSGAPIAAFKRDERKAQTWFKHARTAAEGRNYDYAIELFIKGLRFDPDDMPVHEELREVSLKRKVAGGKPPGMAERRNRFDKDAIGKMQHALMLLALDPLNMQYMVQVMERLAEVGEAVDELNMGEVAFWMADMILKGPYDGKKPEKRYYVRTMECLERLHVYDKAIQACRIASQLDPADDPLKNKLLELETENTIKEGGYGEAGAEGGFRKSVKNLDEQRALEEDDAIGKTADAVDRAIYRRRQEYEEDPSDLDRVLKYINALRQKESSETEQEAVKVLKEALDQTGQYRFKAMIGDIRMKAMARQLRRLRSDYESSPDDPDAKQAFVEGTRKLLLFELQEYEERVQNYPSDMALRFQYGRRLLQAKRYDDAISALQQAKADPKVRAASTSLLGQAYMKQGWFDEAIETLEQGVEQHGVADDPLGMDLRYHLMDAYEKKARQDESLDIAQKANRVASQLLQANINYKDIKNRINAIRALVDELRKKKAS